MLGVQFGIGAMLVAKEPQPTATLTLQTHGKPTISHWHTFCILYAATSLTAIPHER